MLCNRLTSIILLLVVLAAGSAFAQDIGVVPIGPEIPGQGGGQTGPAQGQGAPSPGQGPAAGGASGQMSTPSGQFATPSGQAPSNGQMQAPGGQTAPFGQMQAPSGQTVTPQGQGWSSGQTLAPGSPASSSGQMQAPTGQFTTPSGQTSTFGQVQTPSGATTPSGSPTGAVGGAPLTGSGVPQVQAGQGIAGQPAPGSIAGGGEFSDIEKYISGRAPQELIFDIRQFGYDYFLSPPSTFAPVQNVPVGPDYVIGPGDEIRVNVWGGIEGAWTVTVDRDGSVNFPKIGTFGVAGLTFEEVKQTIQNEFSKSYTDFQMNVSMGQLRSMRIYLVGNARRPGAYSLSSLSTLINALFEAGGPNKVGSMRDVQVMRNGETLVHFDLYDFLLKGQKNKDLRLLPEDVLYIPPIGSIAGIAGNVKVPAIYELKGPTRVSDVIKMAGGVTAKAYLQRVQVERIFENKSKIVVDLDLQHLKDKNDILLANGDLVKVFPIINTVTNKVMLRGNVLRPGEYQWKDGMTVLDLIKSTKDLLPDTLMDIARIDRLVQPDYHMEYRIFNLGKLLLENDRDQNIRLQPYDTVVVFNRWAVQAKETVRSEGALYNPGIIEFRPNMKLSDLIKLSGGFRKYAFKEKAELTRVTPTPEGPKTEKMMVDPENALTGDPIDDIPLQQDDYLFVRAVPEWDLYKMFGLKGEVKYPGNYTFMKGEKLSSVLARAGGFTDKAYPRGAVFVRPSVKQVQQAQISDMIDRLQRELLASGSGEAATAATGDEAKILAEEQKQKMRFLGSMKSLEAKGRVVIALDRPDRLKNSPNDLDLEDGDMLYIPQVMQTVQVVGAVYNQSSFTYQQGKDHNFYIAMAGGSTKSADKKEVYIVKVDGRATKPKGLLAWNSDSNQWTTGGALLEPGDTIIVPDQLDKFAWMRNIKDITQILANVATAAGIVFVGLK